MAAEVVADYVGDLPHVESPLEQSVCDEAEEVEDRLAPGPPPLVEDAAVVRADTYILPVAHRCKLDDVVEEDARFIVERRAGRETDEASARDDLPRARPAQAALLIAVGDERMRHAIMPHAAVRIADMTIPRPCDAPHLLHRLVAHVRKVDARVPERRGAEETPAELREPDARLLRAPAERIALVVDGTDAHDTALLRFVEESTDVFLAAQALAAFDVPRILPLRRVLGEERVETLDLAQVIVEG